MAEALTRLLIRVFRAGHAEGVPKASRDAARVPKEGMLSVLVTK